MFQVRGLGKKLLDNDPGEKCAKFLINGGVFLENHKYEEKIGKWNTSYNMEHGKLSRELLYFKNEIFK